MNNNKRQKAILCIKVRDRMRIYCSNDIGQYFDLLNDNLILQFVEYDNFAQISIGSKKIIELIFGAKVFLPLTKSVNKILRDIDLKYSKKELLEKINKLNIIYKWVLHVFMRDKPYIVNTLHVWYIQDIIITYSTINSLYKYVITFFTIYNYVTITITTR